MCGPRGHTGAHEWHTGGERAVAAAAATPCSGSLGARGRVARRCGRADTRVQAALESRRPNIREGLPRRGVGCSGGAAAEIVVDW